MHSHDRTLLKSLGFADPDKRNRRHDLAIQYLSRFKTAQALLPQITKSPVKVVTYWISPEYHITKGEGKYKTTIGFADLVSTAELVQVVEAPARILCPEIESYTWDYRNGGGREEWEAKKNATWARWQAEWDAAPLERCAIAARASTLYEVKIGPTPIGDVLRQLQLYLEYLKGVLGTSRSTPPAGQLNNRDAKCPVHDSQSCKCCKRDYYYVYDGATWGVPRVVLVTDYDITSDDVKVLATLGCTHVKLGAGFETFVQESSETKHISPTI